MSPKSPNNIDGIFKPTPKPNYKENGVVSYIFGSGRISGFIIPIFLFLGLVAIVWYSYPKTADDELVPIIQADTSDYRHVPKDRGGMKFAHQDSELFDVLESNSQSKEKLISSDDEVIKAKPSLKTKGPELNLDLKLEQTGKTVEAIIAREETVPLSELKKRLKNPAKVDLSKGKKSDVIISSKDIAKPKAKPIKKMASKKTEPKTEIVKVIKAKPKLQKTSKPSVKNTATSQKSAWVVQLGAFSNKKSVSKAWKEESRKYPEIMAGIGYSIQEVKRGSRILYRLRVGNFATRAKAAEFCENLKAKGGSCIVAK